MKLKFTEIKHLLLAGALLFCTGLGFAQGTKTKAFTASGSWEIPSGVTEITIECIGGGGAGGYVHSDGGILDVLFHQSAGGGGGAYAKKTISVIPGTNISITVGAGGYATEANQVDGKDSYVEISSIIVVKAAGGKTVKGEGTLTGANGGQAGNCIGDVCYSGGNGGNAEAPGAGVNKVGGGGGAAGSTGNGNNGSIGASGAAKANYGGKGGDPKTLAGIPTIGKGNAGGDYGGGGSGSKCTGWGDYDDGGDGANGYVLITYKDCDALVINPGTIAKETWVCSTTPDTTIILANVTEATPTPGSYFWELSTDNGSNWSTISGANTNSYTATATGWYRRGFSTQGCDKKGYTTSMEVTHPSEIDPGIISDNRSEADTTVCFGNNLSVTLTSTSTYPKIWQMSVDNGLTWTDTTVTPLVLTNVTQDVLIRSVIQYSLTCELISNNYYSIKTLTKPVVNSLTPIDTCPDLDEYIFVPDITPGSGAITLYHWNGDVAGTTHSTDTLPAYLPERCGHDYHCSLQVEDEYGCKSNVKVGSFTTPSLPSITPITEATAIVDPINCQFVIPDFTDTLNKLYSSDCYFIDTNKQNPVANTPMALGSTIIVKDTIETVCGTKEIFTIEVTAPSILPDLDPSEVTWDDANDTIYLFYGVCDTLYNVTPPTYTSTSPYKDELTLTNNRSSSNSGPILGRLSGNTDTTITWRLSDPCLHSVTYTVHYVVYYPKCGDGVTVTDVDGHTYETVRVGCECWTKTNLRTSTVSDTSFIYQEKPVNDTLFGRLYTWYSAVGLTKDATTAPATTTDPVSNITYIQGVCPTGWAVPTLSAFDNLNAIAGGTQNIKSSNPKTWLSGMAGSDALGFGAVGGGYYTEDGFNYINLLGEAYFWTCEGDPVTKKGACCSITHTCPTFLTNSTYTGMGFSVRCVKRSND